MTLTPLISLNDLSVTLKCNEKKTTESQWPYAVSTFLPLRRRAAITLRPVGVLILARKP